MPSAPISLYLDLEPGQKADLEVVSLASIAFAAAIKELAFVLDPSLEIRIELASGTEGSLSLNSLVRSVKGAVSPETLRTIIVVTTLWFVKETGTWAYDKILDHVTEHPVVAEHTLTKAEIKNIADEVVKAMKGRVGQSQVQRVYKELERDPVVKGVGIPRVPGTRPTDIVPRSEFHSRAGTGTITETVVQKRIQNVEETVTLISPVLVAKNRRWKFHGPRGEFGAAVHDERFLSDLLSGAIKVQMIAGIQMVIDLQVVEEKENGVWVIKQQNVTKVKGVSPAPPSAQKSLFATDPDEDPDDSH